ncbi:hypothetical protein NC653_009569 [Populus alba x Populus x berolinensis]|uniref:Uncharacterized protein n=1 Tax=Populus alba x Populus x berolinensis TaxID=444605 RepID=A0AAD6R9I6_9ROSI|nr:hypothetical protein NC653_009569 [Populus alba x Populus x berolinensis]
MSTHFVLCFKFSRYALLVKWWPVRRFPGYVNVPAHSNPILYIFNLQARAYLLVVIDKVTATALCRSYYCGG